MSTLVNDNRLCPFHFQAFHHGFDYRQWKVVLDAGNKEKTEAQKRDYSFHHSLQLNGDTIDKTERIALEHSLETGTTTYLFALVNKAHI